VNFSAIGASCMRLLRPLPTAVLQLELPPSPPSLEPFSHGKQLVGPFLN
jgi:hypothetical protein